MEDRIAALRARVARLAPEQREAFRAKVEAAGIPWDRVAPEADGPARPARLPLSPSQLQFWLTQALHPQSAAFSIAFAWDMSGPLDGAALIAALRDVMARHAPLRTGFPSRDGQPWQEIADGLDLPFMAAPFPEDPEAAERAFAAQPFDLARAPLWRAQLLSDGAAQHRLLLAFHHSIADGWSRGVFLHELAALYRAHRTGTAPDLPALARPYGDLVSEQARWLEGPEAAAQEQFWREELDGLAPQDLPTDGPGTDRRAATLLRDLPPDLSAAAAKLAQTLGVTPFMLHLALFQLLLHRLSGQTDIAVGTPTAGREARGAEPLIGLFVNTLVLRNQSVAGTSFTAWVHQVRDGFLRAFEHQALPFARVVEAVGAARRLDHSPLFQTLFQLQSEYGAQNAGLLDLGDPDLRVAQRPLPLSEAKFDLSWHMMARDGGLSVIVEYRTALFDGARIEAMLAQYETLLAAAIKAPDRPIERLNFIPASERDHLVDHGATPRLPALIDGFAAQAHSDGPALICAGSGEVLSYRQLFGRAERLARQLRARPELSGATPRLGIALERGPDLVVALLAALQAGIAYVPLDPAHPAARRAHILHQAQVGLLLSRSTDPAPCPVLDPGSLSAAAPQAALPPYDPNRLAYLIFTSGSTGTPKGVPISHSALSNLIGSMAISPGLAAGDRLLALTTIAFDIAALEIFLPLAQGACLVLAPPEIARDPAQLAQAMVAQRITHMQATPATWRALLEQGWGGDPGLTALCGGEALEPALARALAPKVGALWNMYGPTETTIWSAALRLQPAHLAQPHIPVGGPVAHTSLEVLDPYGTALPPGVPGELAIGGAGLSPGYWNAPDVTAAAFPTIDGRRLYRTGDRVARNRDGTFRFLGRLDHQIKLNGYRIEPGEVEAALLVMAEVAQALVLPRGGQLIAYLRGSEIAAADLRARLGSELPSYMIPVRFVWLEAFPLNPNGKIDRARLPDPEGPSGATAPPETEAERALHRIWGAVLGRSEFGIDDNFFDLGGASVSAMQIASRAGAEGLALTPAQLFEHQTIRAQAAALAAPQSAEPMPLSPWQQALAAGGDPQGWRLRLPLAQGRGGDLAAACAGLARRHPALRAGGGAAAWQADMDQGQLVLEADAALLDGPSVARLAQELAATLAGQTLPAAVSQRPDQGRRGSAPLCAPDPIRGDGAPGHQPAPLQQDLAWSRVAAAAAQANGDPAALFAAAMLRVLSQWQRRPAGLVLIETPESGQLGNFTRAVPICLPRATADMAAALAAVAQARTAAGPDGIDPASLPEGLAFLSWNSLPPFGGAYEACPTGLPLATPALCLQAIRQDGPLRLEWQAGPGAVQEATLARLAARVQSEAVRVTARPAQNKLGALKSNLMSKGPAR